MTERFPAGWYPNQQGSGFRFWDGARWTEHYLQSEAPLLGSPAEREGQARQLAAAQAVPGQPVAPGQPAPAPPEAPAQQSAPAQAPAAASRRQTPPDPRLQVAAALLAVLASVAALLVATNLPHSQTDTLVSGGPYVKEPYRLWLLIGGGESIVLGIGLLILTAARVRAAWMTQLAAAAAVLGALILVSAAIVYVSYESARDDERPADTPSTRAAPPAEPSNLLEDGRPRPSPVP